VPRSVCLRRGDFGDDFVNRAGGGFDGAGAGGIADGAEADGHLLDLGLFFVEQRNDAGAGVEELAVAVDDFALMAEVERGEWDVLLADVLPDVHLGPVAEREDAEVLTEVLLAVEDVPKLGALVLRVPLAELIAMAEEALLGAGFLFIATTTAEAGVELMLFNGVEQGDGLQLVAAGGVAVLFLHTAFVDGLLHETHHKVRADRASRSHRGKSWPPGSCDRCLTCRSLNGSLEG